MTTGFEPNQFASDEEAAADMSHAAELHHLVQEQGLEGVMDLYGCDRSLALHTVTLMESAHVDASRWAEELNKPEAVGATYAQAYAGAYVTEQMARDAGMSDERLAQLCGAVTAYQVLASMWAGALPNHRPSESELRRAETAYRQRFEELTRDVPVEPPAFLRDGRMVREALEAQLAA